MTKSPRKNVPDVEIKLGVAFVASNYDKWEVIYLRSVNDLYLALVKHFALTAKPQLRLQQFISTGLICEKHKIHRESMGNRSPCQRGLSGKCRLGRHVEFPNMLPVGFKGGSGWKIRTMAIFTSVETCTFQNKVTSSCTITDVSHKQFIEENLLGEVCDWPEYVAVQKVKWG